MATPIHYGGPKPQFGYSTYDGLQCPPITALELQTVSIATGYGIWLVCGQPFGLTEAFRFARAVDEWTWTLALLLGVAFYFFGVVLWRCRVRQLGLVMIGLVWLAMSLCIIAADPRLPGVWTHWVLAVSAVYASVNVRCRR